VRLSLATETPILAPMPTLGPTAASTADADRAALHTTASGVPNEHVSRLRQHSKTTRPQYDSTSFESSRRDLHKSGHSFCDAMGQKGWLVRRSSSPPQRPQASHAASSSSRAGRRDELPNIATFLPVVPGAVRTRAPRAARKAARCPPRAPPPCRPVWIDARYEKTCRASLRKPPYKITAFEHFGRTIRRRTKHNSAVRTELFGSPKNRVQSLA
jgi:hypothetical protein